MIEMHNIFPWPQRKGAEGKGIQIIGIHYVYPWKYKGATAYLLVECCCLVHGRLRVPQHSVHQILHILLQRHHLQTIYISNCCCLPCNHHMKWILGVKEIYTFVNRLWSTHCSFWKYTDPLTSLELINFYLNLAMSNSRMKFMNIVLLEIGHSHVSDVVVYHVTIVTIALGLSQK